MLKSAVSNKIFAAFIAILMCSPDQTRRRKGTLSDEIPVSILYSFLILAGIQGRMIGYGFPFQCVKIHQDALECKSQISANLIAFLARMNFR